MRAVSSKKAQTYAPASEQAKAAASAYIDSANGWAKQYAAARTELSSFVKAKVKAKALGFVVSDPLSMSAFGIVFETAPGAGFIAVPHHVAEKVRDSGLRGEAFFPDMSTDLGKQMMAKLNAVSRAAEQRPLLNSVPGLKPVAIQDGRLVLTRAVQTEHGPAILAAPAALTPQAEVVAFIAPGQADRSKAQADVTSSQRKAKMA